MTERLQVVLCWHMHQPEYRDTETGRYRLPWTYLHGIKDYVDMAAHLELQPAAKAVVNFSPLVLEQIEDYARQIAAFLEHGSELRDSWLAALVAPSLPLDPATRLELIKGGLRAHEERLIKRFSAYKRLADIVAATDRLDASAYLSDQFIADLIVWQHLAWIGETARRTDARVERLQAQKTNYSPQDRRELLAIIGELLASVLGRYRRLAERGQVELSITPYAHPIVPLLLDISVAREAQPHVSLPQLAQYPGGETRAVWHIERAIESYKHYFGRAPQGCWPSEGAVSAATLKLLARHGFRWAASGENVLRNSLAESHQSSAQAPYQAYQLAGSDIVTFFRDDALSDLIGFTYSTWHADDAVANLLHRLENIAMNGGHERKIVSIIMDGENAWDHYPDNGYYFLNALYSKLSSHPQLALTTYSEILEAGVAPATLERLIAGSWVHGTLATWIGDADKNRAWDMLGDAKRVFDRVMEEGRLTPERARRAEHQLGLCEGSDGFWWFGSYNPPAAVRDFDRLYRHNLEVLYRMLNEPPPDYLSQPFTFGGTGAEQGGVMRRGKEGG
jgi:alpha-amylase/alpha-mannosidase (GH57 family)